MNTTINITDKKDETREVVSFEHIKATPGVWEPAEPRLRGALFVSLGDGSNCVLYVTNHGVGQAIEYLWKDKLFIESSKVINLKFSN